MENSIMKKLSVVSLMVVILLFGIFLGPHHMGDTDTYLTGMGVLSGAPVPHDFLPNRILTTFLGIESVNVLAAISGDVSVSWFFLNTLLYMLAANFFFKLLARIFQDEKVAFIGTVFLAANYGFLLFGLNYLMDIGGWAFYIFSIYFLFKYSQTKRNADLLYAALMVGIGGLFKEYAFLGAVAIAVFVIIEDRKNIRQLFRKALQTASIALVPTLILYVYVYHRFGYTYLDWFGSNREHYVYVSRFIEYIKSLGSLYNFLAFPVLGGLWVIFKKWKEMGSELKSFLIATAVSFLPIFFWPAITQRILTISVPFAIIVSGFAFKRWQKLWWLWGTILVLYGIMTFLMDSYVLNAVNLHL